MHRVEFVARLALEAVRARKDGSPLFASVRLAQNILETGCNLNDHCNLGGFKVGAGKPNEWWSGEHYTTPTWEVYNGKRVNTAAKWRSYASVYHFYKDQDRLFQSVRYARVRASKTAQEQCEALYLCGYATDPDYAKKLWALIEAANLRQYDAYDDDVPVQKVKAPPAQMEDEYVIKEEDANKIVGFLQGYWKNAVEKEVKDELHRLANEVRKAANLPTS